jgi:hypothetical protein
MCTRECDLCSAFGFLYYRAQSTSPNFVPSRKRASDKALNVYRNLDSRSGPVRSSSCLRSRNCARWHPPIAKSKSPITTTNTMRMVCGGIRVTHRAGRLVTIPEVDLNQPSFEVPFYSTKGTSSLFQDNLKASLCILMATELGKCPI